MANNTYDKGDRIAINTGTVFQDNPGDTAFDPDTVIFKVTDPAGTESEYEYQEAMPDDGRHGALTRNGVGDYTLTIDVDVGGIWHYGIFGEQTDGENRGADEGTFTVRSGAF